MLREELTNFGTLDIFSHLRYSEAYVYWAKEAYEALISTGF